jgi:putative transposase
MSFIFIERTFRIGARLTPHISLLGESIQSSANLSPEERDLAVATLRYFENERYELYVFVVMNDHVHVILRTFKDHQLERLLQSLKSYSANQLHKYFGRTGKIWQAESFDRIVRNEEEYYQKAKYIYDNPFNRWPEIKEYMWYGIGKQSINS